MAKPVKDYTINLAASATVQLQASGSFFKVLSATGPSEVTGDGISISSIQAGQGLKDTPFTRLVFRDLSGAPNTVRVIVAGEEFLDASLGGNVIVTGAVTITSGNIAVTGNVGVISAVMPSGTHVHTTPAVTLASTQALAANAARKYLMIQNQHGSGNVWVRSDGAAATATAAAFKIGPGGFWEPAQVPISAINIIGDVATTSLNVIQG